MRWCRIGRESSKIKVSKFTIVKACASSKDRLELRRDFRQERLDHYRHAALVSFAVFLPLPSLLDRNMNILTDLLSQKPQATQQKKQQKGIQIKTEREIAIMRQSARIVATVLKEITGMVEPGMTTADLDAYAEKRIRAMDAIPSFKGLYGFPASICASINNEAVHGIPSKKRVLKKGDVLKVDTGAFFPRISWRFLYHDRDW